MPEQQGRTGSAGRFGARYGRIARRRVAEIEDEARDEHACPECGERRVDRKGTGIWECGYCGYRYAGGAYTPETPGGKTVRRSIRAALSEDAEDAEVAEVTADADAATDADAADTTDAETTDDTAADAADTTDDA